MRDIHERVTECQGMLDHWKAEKALVERSIAANDYGTKWPQPEDDCKYLELCDRMIQEYEADLRAILDGSPEAVLARSPETGQTVYKVPQPAQLQLF